jgi:hypothetical protein
MIKTLVRARETDYRVVPMALRDRLSCDIR